MPSLERDNLTGKAYWRSLDDLAEAESLRASAEGEFAGYDPDEMIQSPSRRSMLKLMGASAALAGVGMVGGCRRWPEENVLPHTSRPENHIPGVPTYYATAFELGGVGQPLLIASFDGRPIKAEGNPTHPMSAGGACSTLAQASLLGMYDPERSRAPRFDGRPTSWAEFENAISGLSLGGGEGFAVLSEATSSPTIDDLRRRLAEKMPGARWYEYEPISDDNEVEGARLAFGKPLRRHLHLDRAAVVVCLDADPLGSGADALVNTRGWAEARSAVDGRRRLPQFWCVDPCYTVTSMNADPGCRLALRASYVRLLVNELAQRIAGLSQIGAQFNESPAVQAFIDRLVKVLETHQGRSLVVAGPDQPAEVHAAVYLINDALGNLGWTMTFTDRPGPDRSPHGEQITALAEAMRGGEVKTLLMIGGNPAHNAPADLDFAAALEQVDTSIHLSDYHDETSARCTWHLPRSHYLEAWGDTRAFDGSAVIVQPLIMPLFKTRSAIEVLAMVLGEKKIDGRELVRRTWKALITEGAFEPQWRQALHDGLLAGSASEEVEPLSLDDAPKWIAEGKLRHSGALGAAVELNFRADRCVYDGRFVNNGWLQELPDAVTKLTWDNAALISPFTAHRLGLKHGDVVRITADVEGSGRGFDAAIYLMPGHADDSVTITLGYGRQDERHCGHVGAKTGFDAYPARTTGAMSVAPARIEKTPRRYALVMTQDHHLIDPVGMTGRAKRVERLVREAPLSKYVAYLEHEEAARSSGESTHGHHGFLSELQPHTPSLPATKPTARYPQDRRTVPLQIFEGANTDEFSDSDYRWAMAIDLNKCTGCSACIIACQAENNIAIVGKDQVARNREMHWLRVDRYFVSEVPASGDVDPYAITHVATQPVTCHQCENAPCEQVCPVAATVHDSEGINTMVYNRCIGTRYCSNNCPYKVRRFNWFDWWYKDPRDDSVGSGTLLNIPDQAQKPVDTLYGGRNRVRAMQFNPEVTVRMRGVMEKCTFCTQRIKARTIPARNAYRQGERRRVRLEDGAITPACAQSCATGAIVFGDLNDPRSRVSRLFEHTRAYEMLHELNVRARTRYLARINRPKDETPPKKDHG